MHAFHETAKVSAQNSTRQHGHARKRWFIWPRTGQGSVDAKGSNQSRELVSQPHVRRLKLLAVPQSILEKLPFRLVAGQLKRAPVARGRFFLRANSA